MRPPFRKVQLKFEHYVPFTPLWMVKRSLGKNIKTILDIGCGTGDPMVVFGHRYSYKVGMDAFRPYIDICQKRKIYDKTVLHDANSLPLPFADKSFDMVIAIRFIEHLERTKVYKLLSEFERIARKRIVLCIPIGEFEQDSFDDNIYQTHRSFWQPSELKERGYDVTGNGVIHLHTGAQLAQRIEKLCRWKFALLVPIYFVIFGIWVVGSVFTQYVPHLAANMICVKCLDQSEN